MSSVNRLAPAVARNVEFTAQMVADVQSWVTNPGANFGWLLKGDETRPIVTPLRFARDRLPSLAGPR